MEAEENAHARSPSAEPLDNLPAGVQDKIGIICGDVRGVLLIQKARVLYQGICPLIGFTTWSCNMFLPAAIWSHLNIKQHFPYLESPDC